MEVSKRDNPNGVSTTLYLLQPLKQVGPFPWMCQGAIMVKKTATNPIAPSPGSGKRPGQCRGREKRGLKPKAKGKEDQAEP